MTKKITHGFASRTQLATLYQFLAAHTVTASMAAKLTGIPQKNICRYKRFLEKSGLVKEVCRSRCLETGRQAWYLSADHKSINTR